MPAGGLLKFAPVQPGWQGGGIWWSASWTSKVCSSSPAGGVGGCVYVSPSIAHYCCSLQDNGSYKCLPRLNRSFHRCPHSCNSDGADVLSVLCLLCCCGMSYILSGVVGHVVGSAFVGAVGTAAVPSRQGLKGVPKTLSLGCTVLYCAVLYITCCLTYATTAFCHRT